MGEVSTTALIRPVSLLAVVILSIYHLLLAHRASSSLSISITTVNRGERTTNLAPLVRHNNKDNNNNNNNNNIDTSSFQSSNANSDDEDMIRPTNIVVVGDAAGGITDDHAVVNVLRNAFVATSNANTNSDNVTITIHNRLYRRELLEPSMLRDVMSRSTNVLWIVTVRPPCHWADTLIRMQEKRCSISNEIDVKDDEYDNGRSWCAGREFASEADYYRMPWHDNVALSFQEEEEEEDDDDDVNSINYSVLRSSIIPNSASNNNNSQTTKYDDIFDMRQRRLLLLKQVMEVMPRRVKVLRLGEFDLNPNVLVRDLVKEYGFTISSTYTPSLPTVDPQRRSDSIDDVFFSCMDYAKWKEAQQRIDWSLEGYFGHNRLDCHLCRDGSTTAAATMATNNIPPTSIYVLGERNSGTTFVANTLAAAFEPPNMMGSKLEKFSVDIPILLHKHMFRHDALSTTELLEIKQRPDILWIMVIRSPCDWVEAMYRKPYHICPPKKLVREDGITPYCGPMSDPTKKLWLNQNFVAGISFIEFLTMEWKDWAESVPFMRDVGKEEAGVPPTGVEMSISKVGTNYTYPNGVFGLRKHKLEIMKQIIDMVPRNVKFVNLKETERSPEAFVQSLVREFHLRVKEGYVPQPPSRVTHSTTCFTPPEWDVAQASTDWHMEAEFGFSPFECRMCYNYTKSVNLFQRVKRGKKVKELINVKDDAVVANNVENTKRSRRRKQNNEGSG